MPETIQIPTDILPADGRFGSGPSKVRDAQVTALAAAEHGEVILLCKSALETSHTAWAQGGIAAPLGGQWNQWAEGHP